MCTAATYLTKDFYFGRNLDLEGSFGEGVIITPQGYKFPYRGIAHKAGYPLIGMGIIMQGVPLYYDAINIHGLGMAGLNFPKNAAYLPPAENKINIAPFEIIPYVLGCCKTVAEAKSLLKDVNFADINFSKDLPSTPLHWIIADGSGSIVAEPTAEGLKVYDNPAGVLTNNPPFPLQLQNLKNYQTLLPDEPVPDLSNPQNVLNFGRGFGAVGLPGDWSPKSRFVRAAFTLKYLECGDKEEDIVTSFFRTLNAVAMPRGAVKLKEGVWEETVYSSCCNAQKGIYYYTTCTNPAIHAVRLKGKECGDVPLFFPLAKNADIIFDN